MIDNQPFDLGLNAAMAEMEMIMYTVTEDALKAAQVEPSEVWTLMLKAATILPCCVESELITASHL